MGYYLWVEGGRRKLEGGRKNRQSKEKKSPFLQTLGQMFKENFVNGRKGSKKLGHQNTVGEAPFKVSPE